MTLIFIFINLFIQIYSLKIYLYLIANEKIDSIYINSKNHTPNIKQFPEINELNYEGNPGDNITISIKPSNDTCYFNGGLQLKNDTDYIYYENWGNWIFDFNVSEGENYTINEHNISLFKIENINNETNYNFTVIIPIEYNCINKSFDEIFNLSETYELDTSEYIKDIYDGNFNSSNSLFIIFTNLLNNSIDIFDYENNTLSENKKYPLLKYKYKFNNYGEINITFTGKSNTDKNQSNNTYYLNFKVINRTFENCSKLSFGFNELKCISCIENNYFIEGNETDCYSECYMKKENPNYFLDIIDKKFKKCFKNCNSCEKLGNEKNNECINCIDKYYKKENDNYNNCYNETPENYYLDNFTIYKKCYQNCKNCYSKGNYENNNCRDCIDDYSFFYDNNKNLWNCIYKMDKPNNYYLNKNNNSFLKCNEECEKCDSIKNCNMCKKNYILFTGKKNKTCEKLNELENNYKNLKNLLPLYNDDFKPYYNLKNVLINESYYIYYSPLLLNFNDYSNFPLIFLDKCQKKLEYNLSELIIALNINQSNMMNFTFYFFKKEDEINLTENCTYIKQFPINKTNNTILLSKILEDKNIKDIISTLNSYDIFNYSSQFYLNPCISFIIDNKEIDLKERKNMILNELNLCPENCDLESFNLIKKIIKCQCQSNDSNINIEKNITFENDVEIFGIKIFTCYQIIYSFPNFNSEIYFHYFNFILLILILFFFCYFYFYEIKKRKKYLYHHFLSSKSNPPKENNSIMNLGNDNLNQMIELNTFYRSDSEINTNSNTNTEQSNESLIIGNGIFTFQGDIKKKKIDFIKEGFKIIKKKLFILSLFSSFSKNCIFFPFSLKISHNLFLFSLICFSSTFSINENSILNLRNYITILITIILCCIIQQIVFYFMEKGKILKNSKYKKKIIIRFIKNLEKISIILYCIYILFGLIFCYFNYIFSVIHKELQYICLINLGITIIGVLIFDLIINIIIIYLKKK